MYSNALKPRIEKSRQSFFPSFPLFLGADRKTVSSFITTPLKTKAGYVCFLDSPYESWEHPFIPFLFSPPHVCIVGIDAPFFSPGFQCRGMGIFLRSCRGIRWICPPFPPPPFPKKERNPLFSMRIRLHFFFQRKIVWLVHSIFLPSYD